MICKACIDYGLLYSVKAGIFSNILYVRNVYLTKTQTYSYETNPSSRQRGYYIRAITARVRLEK
jgi:hypothetical protein